MNDQLPPVPRTVANDREPLWVPCEQFQDGHRWTLYVVDDMVELNYKRSPGYVIVWGDWRPEGPVEATFWMGDPLSTFHKTIHEAAEHLLKRMKESNAY